MKSEQERQSGLVIEEVKDITDQYPKMDGVIQHLSIETNRKFDFKQYSQNLKLSAFQQRSRVSFCG